MSGQSAPCACGIEIIRNIPCLRAEQSLNSKLDRRLFPQTSTPLWGSEGPYGATGPCSMREINVTPCSSPLNCVDMIVRIKDENIAQNNADDSKQTSSPSSCVSLISLLVMRMMICMSERRHAIDSPQHILTRQSHCDYEIYDVAQSTFHRKSAVVTYPLG
jgi:hypothetical protein